MRRKPKFDMLTWRQYRYLEGLRKSRNKARKNISTAKKLLGPEDETLGHAISLKIELENLCKIERERLSKSNPRLKILLKVLSTNDKFDQKSNI